MKRSLLIAGASTTMVFVIPSVFAGYDIKPPSGGRGYASFGAPEKTEVSSDGTRDWVCTFLGSKILSVDQLQL